jgi:hypothetical protein
MFSYTWSLHEEPIFLKTLDHKDSLNLTGYGS